MPLLLRHIITIADATLRDVRCEVGKAGSSNSRKERQGGREAKACLVNHQARARPAEPAPVTVTDRHATTLPHATSRHCPQIHHPVY